MNNLWYFDLQFVSEILDSGTFIWDYGSKQEIVNLHDTKGKGQPRAIWQWNVN